MLPSLKVKIGADTGELNRGLSNVQARLVAFGRIAAKAAAAAAVAIAGLTVASLRNIDIVTKQARSLGLTTRELQRMSLVANEAGVETGALSAMLGLMQRNIIELQRGTQRQVETFQMLGLSIADLEGLSPEQQFEIIADALSRIEDPAQKTAAAMDIFGRSGRAAINMLDGYGEAVDNAAAFQERFGIAVDQTDAEQIEKSNDAMARLASIFTGIGNVLAAKVAPFLENFANSMIYLADQILPDFRGEIGSVERAQYELNEAINLFSTVNTPEQLQTIYGRAVAMRDLADETLAAARAELELARARYELQATDPEAALILGENMAQQQRAVNEALAQLAEAEAAIQAAREGGGAFAPTTVIAPETIESIQAATQAVRNMGSAGDEVESRFEQISRSIESSMENAFMSMIDGTTKASDAFRSMAREIIAELYRIFVVKQITGFISGAISNFFGLGVTQISGPAGASATVPTPRPSFAGGGYTGSGARSGGIDGMGGFPAILHPNETVVDHTAGQGMGDVVVNQTINVSTGVQQTVRTEIRQLMPQIAESAKQAVVDAKRRGGSYGRAFS